MKMFFVFDSIGEEFDFGRTMAGSPCCPAESDDEGARMMISIVRI
jgi:hypothetical protein